MAQIATYRRPCRHRRQPAALPQNVEAEAALLGALMIDNRLAEDIQLKLRPDHFFEPLHGRIYEQILHLLDRNMIASPVTLRPLFEADEEMKELGGPAYLAQLTGSGAAIIGARDFADQIYDLALLRALVGVGREMVEQALDTSEEVDPRARSRRPRPRSTGSPRKAAARASVKSFAQATRMAVADGREGAQHRRRPFRHHHRPRHRSTPRPAACTDRDLIILAGRPGMGKTALATNIAFNAAQRFLRDMEDGIAPEKSAGAGVAFFSLEMSADQLATRILAEQSGISSEKLRMGKISQQDFRNLARAAAELETLPLYIDDTPGLTIAALRTRARRLKRQNGIGLVVVDYLQLLQGTGRNGNDNRVQEISEISRGLKTLAKELDVPVLGAVAAQPRGRAARGQAAAALRPARIGLDRAGRRHGPVRLSRGILCRLARAQAAGRGRRRQDPRSYEQWQREMERVYGLAELIVAKQRHGATGKVRLKFDSQITKFTDLADDDYLPEMRS